jgi:small subunit ribosomal protein S11
MADEIKKIEELLAEESGDVTAEAVEVSEAETKKKKKKLKRQITKGQAHIKCTYNNTMVMISDANGGMLGWSSSGLLGFKGAKKATPYAATQVVHDVAEKVKKYGMHELDVFVKGVGSGRESSIRTLANKGFELTAIKDVTPIPHNGCRAKKPRRV